MKASIGAVIVCDDIRREIGGKEILIGVYAGDIVVASFPFVLVLTIWLEYIAVAEGRQEIHLRLNYTGDDPTVPVNARMEIGVNQVGAMGLPFPSFQLAGNKPGDLVIEFSLDGSDWTEIKRKAVIQGPVQSLLPPATLSA